MSEFLYKSKNRYKNEEFTSQKLSSEPSLYFGNFKKHCFRSATNYKAILKIDCHSSPKLGTWTAMSIHPQQYYFNNVPQDKLEISISKSPVSVDPDDPFNINYKFERKVRKMEYDKFVEKRAGRAPPAYFLFYDKNTILDAVAKGYSPAILYLGRLILNMQFEKQGLPKKFIKQYFPSVLCDKKSKKQCIRQGLALFNQGKAFGNLQCELEALYCRAQLGELKAEDFTPELDLRLADYPLYYMLKYLVANPDVPGAEEFLDRKYYAARAIWKNISTPWSEFLLGAEKLYQFYNYGYDTAYYHIYYKRIQEVAAAHKLLDKAAEKGIVPALYLCGKQYIDGRRSKSISGFDVKKLGRRKGYELLKKAAGKGHLKAKFLLAEKDFKQKKSYNHKLVDCLKPMRNAKYGEAWLLTADVIAKKWGANQGKRKAIIKLYKKAAALGCHRALDRIAEMYYKNRDKNKAMKYWVEFIKQDKLMRNQDHLDVFYDPKASLELNPVIDGELTFTCQIVTPFGDKKIIELLETYR